MARVAVLSPDQFSPELRGRVGAESLREPAQLGSLRVWAQQPAVALALLDLKEALDALPLSPRLLELVRLRIAFHNQCRSCMSMRSAAAIDDGMTEGLVCELQAPGAAEDLTEQERVALAYADRLSIAHHEMDDELFERLRVHFTEEELVALVAHIAFCIGFGRVAMSWDLVDDLPEGLRQEGVVGPWDATGIVRPR